MPVVVFNSSDTSRRLTCSGSKEYARCNGQSNLPYGPVEAVRKARKSKLQRRKSLPTDSFDFFGLIDFHLDDLHIGFDSKQSNLYVLLLGMLGDRFLH